MGGWPEDWDAAATVQSWRRRWVLAVVGTLVILGLVASLVTAIAVRAGDDSRDGRDDTDQGGASGSDPTTPSTTAPSGPVDEAELRQVVEDISAFVEEERGLEFREQVDVELASDDEFEQRLLEDFEEDVDEMERTDVLMTGFGLIDPDVDVVEAMRTLLGGGVVGFYDPETGELVVRGTGLTPYVRTTIAHELVHALDDQHFELDRPQYDDADDEVGFGFTALVEGNARRIENAYRESLTEEEQQQADEEEMTIGGNLDLSAIPFVMVAMLQAPYEVGPGFVEALLDDGEQPALDRAFDEPPRTSEQILHPDAYLGGEARAQVPHPRPGGEVVDQGVAGELLVQLVLTGAVSQGEAARAAEGWGGDWAVAWRDGDRSCVAMAIVGDTTSDTDELREAFGQWAETQGDATVSGASGAPVTVEACAG
jgi:hypothetical protein